MTPPAPGTGVPTQQPSAPAPGTPGGGSGTPGNGIGAPQAGPGGPQAGPGGTPGVGEIPGGGLANSPGGGGAGGGNNMQAIIQLPPVPPLAFTESFVSMMVANPSGGDTSNDGDGNVTDQKFGKDLNEEMQKQEDRIQKVYQKFEGEKDKVGSHAVQHYGPQGDKRSSQ